MLCCAGLLLNSFLREAKYPQWVLNPQVPGPPECLQQWVPHRLAFRAAFVERGMEFLLLSVLSGRSPGQCLSQAPQPSFGPLPKKPHTPASSPQPRTAPSPLRPSELSWAVREPSLLHGGVFSWLSRKPKELFLSPSATKESPRGGVGSPTPAPFLFLFHLLFLCFPPFNSLESAVTFPFSPGPLHSPLLS